MNDERWTLVDRLLGAALEHEPHERAAFLREACGGDDALRLDVESLVTHASSGAGVLRTPAVALLDEIRSTGTSMLGRHVGPYAIAARLGAGGMGEVYRARDTKLGRDVAIKILPRVFATDRDRHARLDREARLLAALNHPHIGAIYGLEELNGTPALILELVEGDTLAERIAKGPIPLAEALRIARQIADALDAAHEKGIVHRDLKPANIKITPDGIVKVLDFGLAKAAGGDGSGPDLTESPTVALGGTHDGVILGTAPYMSPEQARGKPVDKRTDVWAFGCVLYEMLTGHVAFARDTLSDTLAAILDREPEWSALPRLHPPPSDASLLRCLDKDAKHRLRDIGDAWRWASEDLTEPAGPLEAVTAPRRWGLHASWALALLVAVVTAIWVSPRAAPEGLPAPNAVPVIVLMDSPLPGRVYDQRTASEGGTNADDVTDALRELPVAIRKENTSAAWHREEQVVGENPDLIVTHLSCLLNAGIGEGQKDVSEHLGYLAEDRLLVLLAYMASRNPQTRFIVYSRLEFQKYGGEEQWVAAQVARFPILKTRLNAFIPPGGREKASFRDPHTAQLLRTRVAQVLHLGSQ